MLKNFESFREETKIEVENKQQEYLKTDEEHKLIIKKLTLDFEEAQLNIRKLEEEAVKHALIQQQLQQRDMIERKNTAEEIPKETSNDVIRINDASADQAKELESGTEEVEISERTSEEQPIILNTSEHKILKEAGDFNESASKKSNSPIKVNKLVLEEDPDLDLNSSQESLDDNELNQPSQLQKVAADLLNLVQRKMIVEALKENFMGENQLKILDELNQSLDSLEDSESLVNVGEFCSDIFSSLRNSFDNLLGLGFERVFLVIIKPIYKRLTTRTFNRGQAKRGFS